MYVILINNDTAFNKKNVKQKQKQAYGEVGN